MTLWTFNLSAKNVFHLNQCSCLCWKLPQVPAISDAIRQLYVQKLQANKRPV